MGNLYKILRLFLLLVVPALVDAQTSVITYQGFVMGGTSTIILAAPTVTFFDPGCVDAPCQTYATPSTTGSFDAQVAYTGTVAQNNLRIISATLNWSGNNGSAFEHLDLALGGGAGTILDPIVPFDNDFNSNPYPTAGGGWCFSYSESLQGCVALTVVGNVVAGATFNIDTDYSAQGAASINYHLNVGSAGDSFSWDEGEFDPCGVDTENGGDLYVGPTAVPGYAACLIDVSNPTPGLWNAAKVLIDENFDELTPKTMATSAGAFIASGGTVDITNSPTVCAAPASGNCLSLNGGGGTSRGSIKSASITLLPGTNYYLSFDLIQPSSNAASTTVSLGPYSQTFPQGGYGVVANKLVTVSSPTTTNLVFTSNSPVGSSGAALDKVLLAAAAQPLATPRITYDIDATIGLLGWYVTTPTISWTVTGLPTPVISGCTSAIVPNTTGKKYTCSATNSDGSAAESVTVKVDTVPPKVTVASPLGGSIFKLNQNVVAAYTCADVLSGLASCTGTVASGAAILTSATGSHTFSVVSTDNAGNRTTKTLHYRVTK